MKILAFIVGGVLIIFGAMWLLQGLNVLAGSAMSGQSLWTGIGATVAAVGLIVTILGARIKKK